jgi:glycosyltransferase involved in cell wall biosynthesis
VEPLIDPSTRKIVVDVTAVSGQAFHTGVQRMVREFCEAHVDDVLLVRFDGKAGLFRIIPRLSRLRYRTIQGWRGRLRLRLKNLYWNASKEYREEGRRRRWIPKFVRTLARQFYERFLSDSTIERESNFSRRPVWEPDESQTFFLIDLPTSLRHIRFIIELVESHSVRSTVYLHDLFPLSHKSLFNRDFHPGLRSLHMRYLDLVSSADRVVCNSKFTRSQYERFRALLEEPLAQELDVVYPPWPQFVERTDGSSLPSGEVFGGASVRILAVGGLTKRKNFAVLLRALTELVVQGVDARLVLVAGATAQTDPDFHAEMLSLEEKVSARIYVMRQVSDDRLVELYDASTVVAVPSLAEGFGLPVVEALNAQRPVVAAQTTALTELADVLPVTIVDPHDGGAWADALVRVSREGLPSAVAVLQEFPRDWQDFRTRVLGR